jgi:hypothetical protein
MASNEIDYKMHKLNENFTINIRLIETHEWKLRKALAGILLKLAAHVLGCGIKIED